MINDKKVPEDEERSSETRSRATSAQRRVRAQPMQRGWLKFCRRKKRKKKAVTRMCPWACVFITVIVFIRHGWSISLQSPNKLNNTQRANREPLNPVVSTSLLALAICYSSGYNN